MLTTWAEDGCNARIVPLLCRDTAAATRRYRDDTLRGGVVGWGMSWEQGLNLWWHLAAAWCHDEAQIDTR